MRSVNNYFSILFVFFSLFGFAQSNSEKLKQEQSRLERKINNTRALLNKSKSMADASLNELQLLDKQIQFREDLVQNFDNQIRSTEVKIIEKGSEIQGLQTKLKRLKNQYKNLLIYAYKHRNKFGKWMFIISANNYNEAIKRSSYLEYISDIQRKQFLMIRQHQSLINEQINTFQKEKSYKIAILNEKKKEKSAIENDKKKQEKIYQKVKSEESILMAELKSDELKKEKIKQRINEAIKKEIAEAEAKRAKELAKTKVKSKSSTTTSFVKTSPKESETIKFVPSNELTLLNKNFESNKGRLPWPVDKGTITEGFGKNAHPTLENVYTNNNGIDISSPKNAQVRSVFEGEVTSIFSIPGAGRVVIIKHGDYRTAYSNLQEVFVKVGSKVNTKQSIGSLLVKEGESVSVAHFEIHQVVGTAVHCLNPGLWVHH